MADRPLDDRELAAWSGFLLAHASVWKEIEDGLAASGLMVSEYDVLIRLEGVGADGLRMSDLAAQRLMTTGGLTRLVDRLERRGLLQRRASADDGRSLRAVLTSDGQQLVDAARERHHRDVREHFTGLLPASDLDRLADIWDRLLAPGGTGGHGDRHSSEQAPPRRRS